MKKVNDIPFRILLLLLLAVQLRAADTLEVAAFDHYPAIFLDGDNRVRGFIPDLLSLAAESNNWTIQYRFGTWNDGLRALQAAEVDLLTSVAYTELRDKYIDYGSEPILTVWTEVYVPLNSEISSVFNLEGKRISMMRGDFNAQNFRQYMDGFGIHYSYSEVDDFSSVLKDVQNGRSDAGVVNSIWGTAKANDYSCRGSGIVFNPFPLFFAAPENAKQRILNQLDTFLRDQKSDPRSAYYQGLAF